MGNLLDTPVEDIHGTAEQFDLSELTGDEAVDEGSKRQPPLQYALSHMQGWRTSMEDAHIICPTLPANQEKNFPEIKNIALFAVFDGHGGSKTSTYAADNFILTMQESHLYVKLIDSLASGGTTITENEGEKKESEVAVILRDLLQVTFSALDKKLKEIYDNGGEQSGATAIVAVVTVSEVIVANLGDSRA